MWTILYIVLAFVLLVAILIFIIMSNNNNKNLDITNYLSSTKKHEGHPLVFTLFCGNDEKSREWKKIWNEVKLEMDKTDVAYILEATDSKDYIKGWNVDSLPTLRYYGGSGMCQINVYTEYSGDANKEAMINFVKELTR